MSELITEKNVHAFRRIMEIARAENRERIINAGFVLSPEVKLAELNQRSG